MNLVSFVMFASGATLIYAGVKGRDPVSVVKDALQGKDDPGTSLGFKWKQFGNGWNPDPYDYDWGTKPPTKPGGTIKPETGIQKPGGVSGPNSVSV